MCIRENNRQIKQLKATIQKYQAEIDSGNFGTIDEQHRYQWIADSHDRMVELEEENEAIRASRQPKSKAK